MENATAGNLLSQALNEYDQVIEELNKPQEDLVMIAACELIKKSIADFLTAFLYEKGVTDVPKDDITALQQACEKIDKEFGQLNLDSITYLSEDSSMVYTHTLEESRLQRYTGTLKKIRELVLRSV